MITSTEENYLKAIYNLNLGRKGKDLGTNELADKLKIAPATVSNMLKKLRDKDLISYKKYGGITLNQLGINVATMVIRKHRLWETFLYEKMDFAWDEIHEVAEQLEHIKSSKLVEKLDELLGYPEYDPHGDPIPKSNGEQRQAYKKSLFSADLQKEYVIVAVRDSSAVFLQYATEIGVELNAKVIPMSKRVFDGTMEVEIDGKVKVISQKVAENLYVKLRKP